MIDLMMLHKISFKFKLRNNHRTSHTESGMLPLDHWSMDCTCTWLMLNVLQTWK